MLCPTNLKMISMMTKMKAKIKWKAMIGKQLCKKLADFPLTMNLYGAYYVCSLKMSSLVVSNLLLVLVTLEGVSTSELPTQLGIGALSP